MSDIPGNFLIQFEAFSPSISLVDDVLMDNQEDFLEDEERKCCSWVRDCLDCCERSHILRKIKRTFTFVFTYLGLIFMVTCYCLFGAVLFEYLEQGHEIDVRYIVKYT